MILAGDVGGTKTLLGLFRIAGSGRPRRVRERTFASQSFPTFEAIVTEFLGPKIPRVRACAVGVAGPVVANRTRVVNLPWTVDGRRISRRLDGAPVSVINDVEANGWGLSELPRRKLLDLTPGARADAGNAALIAAGTGLGMCVLLRRGQALEPRASEGGHQSFAPRDELEVELWRHLRERHGRVSLERVVSGPGLSAIFEFLAATRRGTPGPALCARLADEAVDRNAAIAAAGLSGEDALAASALDRFVSLYGAAAGDLALVARATGGLFIGGGIAPRIVPKLQDGAFLRAFRDKGRLSPLLAQIPLRVVLEPRTALLGAAACAARLVPPARAPRRAPAPDRRR